MPTLTARLKTMLSQRLPSPAKVGLRRLAFAGLRLAEWVRPQTDIYPPTWMPLVGCGLGRMALPLTGYLQPPAGRYVGFDIEREAIDWCQRNITRRFPHFEFMAVAAHNPNYLSSDAARPLQRFPVPEASFDLVIVTSVFTHLLPAEVETYLAEIARVLRPGGQCLMTFFLLNDESLTLIEAGHGQFPLTHPFGACRAANPNLPQAAIAYPETQVLGWLERLGLHATIHYGSWCGRAQFVDGQDMLVVTRPGG